MSSRASSRERKCSVPPAEGYRARGFIRGLSQWDWKGANDDLGKALALSPENADILYDYTVAVLQPAGHDSLSIIDTAETSRLGFWISSWASFMY